jgi:hypothetical protein
VAPVKADGRTEIINTTSDHLFWNPAARKWVQASKLRKGERLKTADGKIAVADGGTTLTGRGDWMWDLTIPGNGDHDFYVLTGTGSDFPHSLAATAVLVHNDDGPSSPYGTLFKDGPYRFQIYTNDHGPAHGHLFGPGIGQDGIQIGQNGKPLDPNITLTGPQQEVISDHLPQIRKAIGDTMRMYRINGCA